MAGALLHLIIVAASLGTVFSACTYPSSIGGTWTSGNDVITVNSTHLIGYSVDMYKSLCFTCFLTDGAGTYVMKSNDVVEMFGRYVYIYVCWKLVPETSNRCRFYELALPVSQNAHDKGRAFFPGDSPSLNTVCQLQDDGSVSPRYLHKTT